jgi:hypothetical protein
MCAFSQRASSLEPWARGHQQSSVCQFTELPQRSVATIHYSVTSRGNSGAQSSNLCWWAKKPRSMGDHISSALELLYTCWFSSDFCPHKSPEKWEWENGPFHREESEAPSAGVPPAHTAGAWCCVSWCKVPSSLWAVQHHGSRSWGSFGPVVGVIRTSFLE